MCQWRWILVCSCFLFPIFADEDPQPPADPALKTRIEAWVKDLGHSDFKRREEATRLLAEAGDAAVWALRPAAKGTDPEAASRASELLEQIAWIPSSTRARIDELIEEMKESRDPSEVSRILTEVLGFGKPGIRRLRPVFPERKAGQDDVALTVEMEKLQYRRAEPVSCKAVLKNVGKEPLWINASGFSLEPTAETLCATTLPNRRMSLGVSKPSAAGGLLHLKPGEACEVRLSLEGFGVDFVGRLEAVLRYKSEDIQAGGGFRRAGPGPDDGKESFRPHPAELSAECKVPPVFLLPAADSEKSQATLELSLSQAEVPSQEPFAFSLALAGKEPGGITLAAPRDGAPVEGFWAGLFDEKGNAVEIVSFAEAPDAVPDDVVKLSKGDRIDLSGQVRFKAGPGSYRMRAGYSSTGGGMRVTKADPARGRRRSISLWRGDIVSQEVTITLK